MHCSVFCLFFLAIIVFIKFIPVVMCSCSSFIFIPLEHFTELKYHYIYMIYLFMLLLCNLFFKGKACKATLFL